MKFVSLQTFIAIIIPFAHLVLGQNIVKSCGTQQTAVIAKDKTHRFSYLQYPRRYPKNLKCTWNFRTVNKYAFDLNCNVSIPCQGDQLRVSKKGNLNAAASVTSFCGNRTARVTSVANTISLNLRSSPNSRGGTMLCRLTSRPIRTTSKATTTKSTSSTARTTTSRASTNVTTPAATTKLSTTVPPITVTSTTAPPTSTSSSTTTTATTTASTTTPLETTTTVTTKTTTAYNSSCKCGIKGSDQRIVGGSPAGQTEYPWQVMMVIRGYLACGGAVIAPNWVLTAAHCTYGEVASNLSIVAGRYSSSQASSTSQYRKVKRFVQHEGYSPSTIDNDISLLELETPLNYTTAVQPICLPYKYVTSDFKNQTVIAIGWGTTSYGGSMSTILLEVSLPVLTTDECRGYYGIKYITDNMFCTYMPGKDSCQGDSGGPINWIDPSSGRVYVVGIVSWGDGCAAVNSPGVITKVTNYLDWIRQKTGLEFCNP